MDATRAVGYGYRALLARPGPCHCRRGATIGCCVSPAHWLTWKVRPPWPAATSRGSTFLWPPVGFAGCRQQFRQFLRNDPAIAVILLYRHGCQLLSAG